jgi:hypothetical protein
LRRDVVEHRDGVSPRPPGIDRFGDRTVGLFGERNVGAGVVDDRLVQRGIAGMSKYLVDAATGHHIAAQKDGQAVHRHALKCS